MKRLLLAVMTSFCVSVNASEGDVAIAIHGGAGTITKANLSSEQETQYKDTLKTAITAAYSQLQAGASSLEAVQTAIVMLEDSPLFNAGKGAVYTYNGGHELDASVMDGKTLNAGAIAGVKTIKNPISLAIDVMNKSPHVMLSGIGAEQFAESLGYEQVDNGYFDTPFRHAAWQRFMAEQKRDKQAYRGAINRADYKFGTVGAVALDKQGNIAAGTSTGGMTGKRWGRVGDSPVIGAGTYANNESCAVSATGHGEFFIRYNVAATICARMQYANESLQQSAETVINKTLKSVGGDGGVVALDKQGNIAMPFNTEGMYRASIDKSGKISVSIY
ncbi:MAG: isoaspartyl peptidase/L-asparaginase family protein [Aestuariibacter sp.]